MSFVVYLFVLLIAAGSVLFGLDWVQAPMSPMPASQYELQAAKPPPQPAPPPAATTEVKPAPEPAPAVSPPQPAQTVAEAPPVAEPAPLAAPVPVAAAPKCDIDACTAAYRSFTAIDCTYQPTDGPRRLCTKGRPPTAATPATAAPTARAQATCNVAACSQAYISFSATDCTYQPIEGPRRLCEK
jgi:outer membrane biosynthesis protein TonB